MKLLSCIVQQLLALVNMFTAYELMMMMRFMNYFCDMVDRRKTFLVLFQAATIVRDPHHRESLTRHEQDLNMRRT